MSVLIRAHSPTRSAHARETRPNVVIAITELIFDPKAITSASVRGAHATFSDLGLIRKDEVATTHAPLADPIVSFLIAGLILHSSYCVLSESATVLLEGTPAGTDMPAVIAAMKNVGGVLDVHDLHVWMVGSGAVACGCHIVVAEQSIREGQQVLHLDRRVHDIEHWLHITHTTVQVEVEGCDANDMYCRGQRSGSRSIGS